MRPVLWVGGGLVLAAVLAAVWLLGLQPRPPDTTEPSIFEPGAADVDYCRPAALDGAGPAADDIPKAYTPGCGWARWPGPVLASCREPLSAGARDLRGLWRSTDPSRPHVERIEQCGDRMVVTTAGIIHDFRTDGTLARGADDVEPPRCLRIRAAVSWRDDGVLAFRPFGLPWTVVTRRLEGDRLVWTYPGQEPMTMTRICRLSEAGISP